MKNNKNESTIKILIKFLKKFEKYDPQILLIPEDQLINPEKVKDGALVQINEARIISGMQFGGSKEKPVLFIGTQRLLEAMLQQAKDGVDSKDMILSADNVLVKKEDVKKIKASLKKKKKKN